MSILLYFFPGVIAVGGAVIYHFVKGCQLVKLISISFYMIAFISIFIQVAKLFGTFTNNLPTVMSGELTFSFPIKAFISATIYIILATVLRIVSKKLESKEAKNKKR